MRFPHHSLFLTPVLLAAAASTIQPACAEMLRIPFNFTVGGKVLPAGAYTVKSDISMHTVTLRNDQTKQTLGWVVGPGQPDPTDTRVAAHFDKSASGYALRSIQYHSQTTSQLDKKLRRSEDVSVSAIAAK